jgi:uncharacterized membrane protein
VAKPWIRRVSTLKSSIFSVLSGSVVVLSLNACNFNEQKGETDDTVVEVTEADLNYANVNTKFFSLYCLSCHSSAGGNRAGINLESYANVMAQLDRVKGTVLEEGSMPPSGSPPVSAGAAALLKAWIDAGAPQ